jgi:hypothetical protein
MEKCYWTDLSDDLVCWSVKIVGGDGVADVPFTVPKMSLTPTPRREPPFALPTRTRRLQNHFLGILEAASALEF